jgi:7-cyano-7-deazaguanine synthase
MSVPANSSNDIAADEKAVVLLSGGLDSATVLAHAHFRGYQCYSLSVDYGQHARHELEAAIRIAKVLCVHEHMQIPIGLHQFGGSALVTGDSVPTAGEAAVHYGIPETYVPARNTVLLSLALGWAEVLGAYTIYIGANSLDYSGYPDCRPEYIKAYNELARLAVAEGSAGGRPVRVEAPLMHMSKAEIIQLGTSLGFDYGLTVSCYQPGEDGMACGRCESCVLRLKGFAQADLKDPILYSE